MSTKLLELDFFIDPIDLNDEDLLDKLDEADISITQTPSYSMASALIEANPREAAERIQRTLQDLGIKVLRLDHTIVNAAGIADRCGVSRPTVYGWTKQEGFPKAHTVCESPLWSWHEVREWIMQRPRSRVRLDGEPETLCKAIVDSFNAKMALRQHSGDSPTHVTMQIITDGYQYGFESIHTKDSSYEVPPIIQKLEAEDPYLPPSAPILAPKELSLA